MAKKYSQTRFIVLACHDIYVGDTTRSIFNFGISVIIQFCVWVTGLPDVLSQTASETNEGFWTVYFISKLLMLLYAWTGGKYMYLQQWHMQIQKS